ncbi:hypothetical protein D3C84_494270 [compost metagenome]
MALAESAAASLRCIDSLTRWIPQPEMTRANRVRAAMDFRLGLIIIFSRRPQSAAGREAKC